MIYNNFKIIYLATKRSMLKHKGFTLIETLVALSLMMVAIIAPLSMTSRSLITAYYAKDQITASYLAQDALEAVRALRDGNILSFELRNTTGGTDLFNGIPIGRDFIINTLNTSMNISGDVGSIVRECIGSCELLSTDGTFYGYNNTVSGWRQTQFMRKVRATPIEGSNGNEIKVVVTVSWQTQYFPRKEISISENMYRWIKSNRNIGI